MNVSHGSQRLPEIRLGIWRPGFSASLLLPTPLPSPSLLSYLLLSPLLFHTWQMQNPGPPIGVINLQPTWTYLKQIEERSPEWMRLREQFKYCQSSQTSINIKKAETPKRAQRIGWCVLVCLGPCSQPPSLSCCVLTHTLQVGQEIPKHNFDSMQFSPSTLTAEPNPC